jgi:hypothetical protein
MGSITALRPEQDIEERALDGLCALIQREVETRLRPIKETLEQIKSQSTQGSDAEEYLGIEALAVRINTPTATIRDWVYKKNKNGIPVIKIPTGALMFAWSEFETWLRSQES